jgi:hypothetical protein
MAQAGRNKSGRGVGRLPIPIILASNVLLEKAHLPAEAVPLPTPALPLGFSTAGDAADGLLFGWDLATVQQWVLIYLGLSSLGFIIVWVVGYLRRK